MLNRYRRVIHSTLLFHCHIDQITFYEGSDIPFRNSLTLTIVSRDYRFNVNHRISTMTSNSSQFPWYFNGNVSVYKKKNAILASTGTNDPSKDDCLGNLSASPLSDDWESINFGARVTDLAPGGSPLIRPISRRRNVKVHLQSSKVEGRIPRCRLVISAGRYLN